MLKYLYDDKLRLEFPVKQCCVSDGIYIDFITR